ncbi:hypothetical protein SAMD00019534_070640, partial [Acytostelium subglobosum LB1]|uniref:hypothetical protein n=1 Tax=Acytostelium subglobosum LB1 TaxID=1410327 RepID=UPI000644EF3A
MNNSNYILMLNSNKWEERVKATTDFYTQLVKKDNSKELYALMSQNAASGANVGSIIYNIVVGAVYCIPTAGNFIALGLTAVWNIVTEVSKKQENTSELITSFKKMIQTIVDDSITIYDNETLIAHYKTCSTHIVKYADDIRNLRAAPTETNRRTEVRETVKLALDNLQQGIDLASKQSFAVSELFIYSLMATTRMLLLRDLCMNGTSWDIPAASINSSYLPELRKNIVTYTKWCMDTYKVGYTKLKADNTDDVNLFNKIQQYRNFMITEIFDVVSIWPFLDPSQYPNCAVFLQRPRVLLGPTIGCPTVGTTKGDGYYSTKCTELEKLVATNKYYVWRGDHEKLYMSKDETGQRFTSISNGFVAHDSDAVHRDTTVAGTIVGKEESIGFSDSANESVTVNYDVIPRSIILSVGGSIKCSEDQTKFPWCDTEFSWHRHQKQYPFPNIDSSNKYYHLWEITGEYANVGASYVNGLTVYGNSSRTVKYPNHKVHAIWSWGTNTDGAIRAAGCVDSVFAAFVDGNVFNYNTVIPSNRAQVIDSSKYFQLMNGATIEQEIFGPGGAALLVKANEQGASYTFHTGNWAANKKYTFFMRATVRAATATTIFMRTNDKRGATITVPVPANPTGFSIVGGNLCNFQISSDGQAVEIGTNGSVPVYIRNIILIRDKEVTAA